LKKLFADTSYWIAVANPRDDFHEKALSTSRSMGPVFIVTSDPVLAEFLNDFSGRGAQFRRLAAALVDRLKRIPNCEVVPWNASLFDAAFALYKARADKHWSLTDCTSFVIMYERKISEALASERHFQQAGYTALLR
jgi:predicted nucleic acid-binding protein